MRNNSLNKPTEVTKVADQIRRRPPPHTIDVLVQDGI